MFSSSILHYIIWSDKCYLLIHIIVEIHLFGYLVELSLSPSATSSSSPWLNDEPLIGTRFHSSFPENHIMSSRQLCCTSSSQASWVWDILTPIRYESRSDMMVGTHFPRVITLVFIWPGKVMSCLAHLAGGPIVIVLPFSNVNHPSIRKLKDLFYKLFLMNPLSIQSPTLLGDHVNAISSMSVVLRSSIRAFEAQH